MSGDPPLLPLSTMYDIYTLQLGFHPVAVVSVPSPIHKDNEKCIYF